MKKYIFVLFLLLPQIVFSAGADSVFTPPNVAPVVSSSGGSGLLFQDLIGKTAYCSFVVSSTRAPIYYYAYGEVRSDGIPYVRYRTYNSLYGTTYTSSWVPYAFVDVTASLDGINASYVWASGSPTRCYDKWN